MLVQYHGNGHYRGSEIYKMILEAGKLLPPPIDLMVNASLFLDFDGTLVEIAVRPEFVHVGQRLRQLMAQLHTKLSGRLAIISGRSVENIRALFPDAPFVVAGSHGAELSVGETVYRAEPLRLDGVALRLLQGLRERHPGILIEIKPLGLALHYRQAPQAKEDCYRFASDLAARTGLAMQPGKKVIELKLADHDKGTALLALMRQPPLCDGHPLFIGDDETDEVGFRAAAALGGAGVLVGEVRSTAALFRLANVERTLTWLEIAGAAA
jgi:trehalose 6-phosphate phosphatase